MVRIASLRSLSNCRLTMRCSRSRGAGLVRFPRFPRRTAGTAFAGLRAAPLWRTMGPHATAQGKARSGRIDDVADAKGADHRRRAGGHVLRALAAQLRARAYR